MELGANDTGTDVALKRMLCEQLDAARSSTFAPMAFLHLTVAELKFEIDLGMSVDGIDAMLRSGFGKEPLVISDSAQDPRAPASWRNRGIGACLSVPIRVDDRFAGVLYIVDVKAREFTDCQIEAMSDIGYAIGKRLERFLGPEREERRESLMRRAVSPAFAELRNALVPLNLGTSDLRMVAADLMPVLSGISDSEEEEHQVATRAFNDFLSLIEEISRASERVREVTMVVEGLWGEGGRTVVLQELLQTSVGLALHSTRLVGGVSLPNSVPAEFTVRARRSVAAAGLGLLLSRAAEMDASNVTEATPLVMTLDVEPDYFTLRVVGKNLSPEGCEEIAVEVEMLLMGDQDLSVSATDTEVLLRLTRCS